MLGEQLNHIAAKGRLHDVGDKDFLTEIADIHLLPLGELVPRRNHEREGVAENFGRSQLLFLGDKGDDSQIEMIVQQFRGDIARIGSPHGQAHVGIEPPVARQRGKQGMDGAFVDSQRQLAATAAAQVIDRAPDLLPQIEHALGIAG